MTIRTWLVLMAIAAWSGTALGVPASCTPDEETVFTCPSGRKQISVCASKGWTANGGYVQYRYGSSEKAEMVLPRRTETAPSETITIGRGPISGGGYAFMRFRSGAFRYTVYSAIVGQLGAFGGVVVDRVDRVDKYADAQEVAVHQCKRGREGKFADGVFSAPKLPADAAEWDFVLPSRQ